MVESGKKIFYNNNNWNAKTSGKGGRSLYYIGRIERKDKDAPKDVFVKAHRRSRPVKIPSYYKQIILGVNEEQKLLVPPSS